MTEKELARRWRGLRGGGGGTSRGERGGVYPGRANRAGGGGGRGGREVVTSRGKMRVLYPGRANGGRGPDFIGAALLGERGMVRGDVEVHRSSRAWEGPGHPPGPPH